MTLFNTLPTLVSFKQGHIAHYTMTPTLHKSLEEAVSSIESFCKMQKCESFHHSFHAGDDCLNTFRGVLSNGNFYEFNIYSIEI